MVSRLKFHARSACILSLFAVFIWFSKCNAQNATLDPSEARALNSIFQQWRTKASTSWNISGEPCTGSALLQSLNEFEDPTNNPGITCDCSFSNNTLCHIIRLRAYDLDLTGEIPMELLDFPYLNFLKIDRNFFTGPLPAFVGNMSSLGLLSLAQNALSGPLPVELGNIGGLYLLSLGINNFSGSLPPELGQLVELGEFYMNSCGLSGEIPSTFAKLESLRIVWAFDNDFTGKIPDFIGNNWTKLTSLRFEGNSFEGPIPISFGNLTSLQTLRIGGIYNGSSTLEFVRNLKNLTNLVLRNVLLTGSIASYISELQSLQILDLSFNNLTGVLPTALFNMNSLSTLFLGNNRLTGQIPTQKSGDLQIIDLSYNFLSGSLPSWATSGLQLNFVGNNLTINGSNARVFRGLTCLQRSFPCNKNPPLYASFSIKCGGPQVTANGINFEAENSSTFGASTFIVSSSEKWAVSNAGLFLDADSRGFVFNNLGQVSSTNAPQLYRTSRISPGSLRYYGLGLENGSYNVTFYFAETAFPDRRTESTRSLGRRVFDVFVQGRRVLRDFDISKAAGGIQREILQRFITNVTENYLEIHLFWAGKGTCCTPDRGYYGPIVSAINVAPNFRPSVSEVVPGTVEEGKNQVPLIVGITLPACAAFLVIVFCAVVYAKRKREDGKEVLHGIGTARPVTFNYSELRVATEDFSASNKLGEGGFGPVYKGTLPDGRVIAVKRLSLSSNQGESEFVTEIATISAVQHFNLIKLYGCCIEGNRRLLVYEYLENKSLDLALFGADALRLDWSTRFSICLSVARALSYLHEDSRPRIVHRDVKASNILLDADFCPKLSDFGLARLYDDKKMHISTRVAGTIGYLAPEYAMLGHLTEKADVFAFGVVALEIVSGRPNSDSMLPHGMVYLLDWTWTLHERNQIMGLADPTLAEFDPAELLRVIEVALLCTQASPSMRPPMSRALAMLSGDVEVARVTTKPGYLTDWNFDDDMTFSNTTATQRSSGVFSDQ